MAVDGTTTPRAGRRAAIAAVAVVGWVLIVMVAAGPRPDDRTWIGLPALDDLMGVAFVALIIWALVWTVRVVRVGSGAKQHRPLNLITLWLGLAVGIAVLMANPSIVQRLLEVNPTDSSRSSVEEPVEEEPPAPVDFTVTANQVYIALAAVAVWLGATAAARRRTIEDDGVADDDLVDRNELSRTIDGMVYDLELGTDPRAAVLTAYDRLERALAQHDCPRKPTETPTEHLDRVLARLPIDRTPLLDLARRYEVARFSSSRVTETDRSRAATDLARIRDDLSRLARP